MSELDEAAAIIREHATCTWLVPNDSTTPEWSCGVRHDATAHSEHVAMLVLAAQAQAPEPQGGGLTDAERDQILTAAWGMEPSLASIYAAVERILAARAVPAETLADRVRALADEIEQSQRGPEDRLIGLRWAVDRLRALLDPAERPATREDGEA